MLGAAFNCPYLAGRVVLLFTRLQSDVTSHLRRFEMKKNEQRKSREERKRLINEVPEQIEETQNLKMYSFIEDRRKKGIINRLSIKGKQKQSAKYKKENKFK